ncbi:hypothetical protein [uncultured Nostoc sp.]|uniref:hypothetical protein n=1 Tax=uncultured Nostoc sp. TaxID=340711 RepID=UPI0035C9FB6C
MSRPFQIEISESQEELEKALRHATQASSIRLIANALLAQEWASEQQAIALVNVNAVMKQP